MVPTCLSMTCLPPPVVDVSLARESGRCCLTEPNPAPERHGSGHGPAMSLDAGFVEHLNSYTGAHASLAEQVAATTAILGEAEKTQVSKATKALSGGKAIPALPAPAKGSMSASPSAEPDDDDDSDSLDSTSASAPAPVSASASAPAPASSGTDLASLFD